MRTPVADFIDSYIAGDGVRAHMPGHKGAGPLGIEVRDITEIAGADVLSESVGILGESQKNACTLFGTGATLYSTEGSSLAVKAMLYSVMMHWKRNTAGRLSWRQGMCTAPCWTAVPCWIWIWNLSGADRHMDSVLPW